jgi:hypothetical protein
MTPDERLAISAVAGVWSAEMANTAGYTRHQIATRRGMEWQTLRRGTYAYAGVAPSPVMRAASAVLAAGGTLRPAEADESWTGSAAALKAVAAGRSAARIWGIPLVDDEDPAVRRFEARHDDVIRRRGESVTATLHTRRVALEPADVVHVDGVPVLAPLRTLLDLPNVLRPDALVAALDHALHVGLVSLADLHVAAGRDRRGQGGVLALRAALALTDPKAESPHESLTRLVLKPVLPGLRSQVRVYDRNGRILARLDLGDEELKLGVESDGAAYHRGRAAADRKRDFRTGWTIERVSWHETRCEQHELKRRVLSTAGALRAKAA